MKTKVLIISLAVALISFSGYGQIIGGGGGGVGQATNVVSTNLSMLFVTNNAYIGGNLTLAGTYTADIASFGSLMDSVGNTGAIDQIIVKSINGYVWTNNFNARNLTNLVREIVVTEHGIIPDDGVDDGAKFQALWNTYPQFTTFAWPAGTYHIGQTITNPMGSMHSRFVALGSGTQNFVKWRWNGPTNGTVNSALLDLDSCDSPYFENIYMVTPHTNAVRKLVNIDQVKGGATMTEWEFNRCQFVSENEDTSREQWLVMVSTNATENCEHGRWINCTWNAGGHGQNFTNKTIGLFLGNNPNMLNLLVRGGGAKYCTNFLAS